MLKVAATRGGELEKQILVCQRVITAMSRILWLSLLQKSDSIDRPSYLLHLKKIVLAHFMDMAVKNLEFNIDIIHYIIKSLH